MLNHFNILVRNVSDSILFQDNTWISESSRKIKAGEFRDNVAKSNYLHGIQFLHHESGEEIKLSGVKTLKKSNETSNTSISARVPTVQNSQICSALFE